MTKVQDLFKRADGSKLLDVKLLMEVKDIPMEAVTKNTTKGTAISVFPVKLVHQGHEYEWDMGLDQLQRVFTKKNKDGSIRWQAKNGDNVYVWYASNAKNPTRPYYDAASADTTASGVEAAEDVFGTTGTQASPENTEPLKAKPKFASSKREKDDVKWDGTPRQSSFRQGYAGMIQALICNPAINPHSQEDMNFVIGLARQLVKEVRVHSKVLEQDIED